jgi:hypothetical protein
VRSLAQQFGTMSKEQEAWSAPQLLPQLRIVEDREPRLTEPCRQDNQCSTVALFAGITQS